MISSGLNDWRRGAASGQHPVMVMELLRQVPMLSFVFGVATIVQGFGAFLNHLCGCHLGHAIDVVAMYAVSWFLVLYHLFRLTIIRYSPSPRWSLKHGVVFTWLLVVVPLLLWLCSESFYVLDGAAPAWREELIVTALIALSAVVEWVVQRSWQRQQHVRLRLKSRYMIAAAVSLLLGVAAHKLELKQIGCNPHSNLQLHAVFHVLSAAALYFSYRHLRQ